MDITYLSRSKLNHSVNAVYIKGLRANDVSVDEMFIRRGEFWKLIKGLIKDRKKPYMIMIGYNSPILVVIAKVFSGKRVIYSALCSVYERLVVSRNLASKLSPRALYYWFIDFLAVHLSDLVMLETDEQIKYFKKLFFASGRKLYKAWTGVDEELFHHKPDIKKFDKFSVMFRGALMPESGAEYAIKAAKILEDQDINLLMISNGMLINEIENLIKTLHPKNLKLIKDLLPREELVKIMQSVHVSLGQLSDHERLNRTIPHKCYESLAMKLPYLTAANKGVLELLRDGESCFTCEPANAELLAEKILWAKSHPEELERIAENGYRLFKENLTSKLLAGSLMAKMSAL